MSERDYKAIPLDARPDRLDLRDREYRPHLRSLPSQFPADTHINSFLAAYEKSGLILNQGKEGACTGFGLAATINYLIFKDKVDANRMNPEFDISKIDMASERVSERMLYHMARIYDEWEGEDYSGSSCRGAMKGWHRHGVCKKSKWPYETSGEFMPPEQGWEIDALKQPLGAYYRINHDAVVDMQAAISEVGAIYCSANVHKGWWLGQSDALPVMAFQKEQIGGHAFCIVGYNQDGFIVQNSWGGRWGWNGFAVLQYADWVANGSDAWVVSRGVAVSEKSAATKMFANNALQDVATARPDAKHAAISRSIKYDFPPGFPAKPWTEEAYAHALVITNNGRPKHTFVEAEDCEKSAQYICYDKIKQWCAKSTENRKIVVYAHGGLVDEESSINQIRVMAPYFKANGIYPVFVIWKTGLFETIGSMIRDQFSGEVKDGPAEFGWWEDVKDWVSEKVDRAVESVAQKILVKGLWSEMKENATFASDRAVPGYPQTGAGKSGAMVLLARALKSLSNEFDGLELHMAGHSAGSILLGAWLKEVSDNSISTKTVSLFAPACTIEFANKTYLKAMKEGLFSRQDLHIHNMDDEREQADATVPIYNKSLLYLVSRALEDLHKMPLLGLASAWDPSQYYQQNKSGGFQYTQKGQATRWLDYVGETAQKLYTVDQQKVLVGQHPVDYIDLPHGSFDNDIAVIEFTLKKITGKEQLAVEIENLSGY